MLRIDRNTHNISYDIYLNKNRQEVSERQGYIRYVTMLDNNCQVILKPMAISIKFGQSATKVIGTGVIRVIMRLASEVLLRV